MIGTLAAIALAAATLGGAAISSGGAKSAANTQAAAAGQSNALQQAMYNQTREDLGGYREAGQQNLTELQSRMGELNTPFSMTQDNLEKTPGYQFTRDQGLKSVNNAMGARGLLNSGAAMRGAADYATGLADQTYTNQFNMDQTQKQNIFNRLIGGAQLGENAAAQTGAFGTQTAANQAQGTIGAGNARAGAAIAQGNAFAGIANSFPNAMVANQLFGKNGSMYGQPSGPLTFNTGRP